MDLGQLIQQILEQARDEIRANLSANNINASGRTSASIQVKRTADGFKLVGGGAENGAAPLFTTEIGRAAGKIPANFTDILMEWASAKGLDIDPWAVAMSIKKKGTRRHYQEGGQKDVYSTVTKQTEKRLQEGIGQAVMSRVRESIRKNF